jgi:hypothetical protein
MAAMMVREFHAKRPEHLDPANVVVRYDDMSDTLMVHLHGLGRPGVSVPVIDGQPTNEYFRLDPVSEEIIGMQIEAFLSGTVYRNAVYLAFAELAGIDSATLERVREEMVQRRRALDEDERKRIALEELFGPRLFQMMG